MRIHSFRLRDPGMGFGESMRWRRWLAEHYGAIDLRIRPAKAHKRLTVVFVYDN